MSRDSRFNDRLDFKMGIMAFIGVGIAVFVPFFLIVTSLILQIPFLDHLIMSCQVVGCIVTGVALSYFILRKET